MNITRNEPPRAFEVGHQNKITLYDCGRVELKPDEQVTFVTESGAEYDVARKSWGFYATPSLNSRLGRFGLRPILVLGLENKYFILFVEKGREVELKKYLAANGMSEVCWLDDDAKLAAITQHMTRGH
jgi:hypothetical protein